MNLESSKVIYIEVLEYSKHRFIFDLFLKLRKSTFQKKKKRFMVRSWSLPNYLASNTKYILRHYYFVLAAGNEKILTGKCDSYTRTMDIMQNESTWRLVDDGMSKGLTNTHTDRGFSALYYVFARKQCILSSALLHKSYLTPRYVTSIRNSFCLGTLAQGFIS